MAGPVPGAKARRLDFEVKNMPSVKVHDLKNKEVGEINLPDEVFGVELNEGLIHAAVRNYLANARQGTSKTKTRGDVRGGGKKPWRQKGTGRARVASIRSPLWRGGGRVHGPVPKDWSYKMPKKMRRGALRAALSERLREGNLFVVEDMKIGGAKTKGFVDVMAKLGFYDGKKQTKTLLVDSLDNRDLILSSRNVQKTKVVNSYGVNVYDLVYHEKIVISKFAIEELAHILDPKREKNVKEAA
jgi:large subunit ribosomal protein L4